MVYVLWPMPIFNDLPNTDIIRKYQSLINDCEWLSLEKITYLYQTLGTSNLESWSFSLPKNQTFDQLKSP